METISDLQKSAYLEKISELIEKFTPHDGFFKLANGSVNLSRSSKTSLESTSVLAQPSLCIVPQGAKYVEVMKSDQSFVEDGASMVVYGAEVPLKLRIKEASEEQPYYCLMIPIKPETIHRVSLKVFPDGVPKVPQTSSVFVNDSDLGILKSALHLLEVMHEESLEPLVVPLIIEEILIRLLSSPIGPRIAQMGMSNSHAVKVAKAISWIKTHYAEAITTDELASLAGMSVSSLHHHFKAITSMSPLQFQKVLRLQAARTLIRTRGADITNISADVGYASLSQFSREYSREFGVAPSRDAQ